MHPDPELCTDDAIPLPPPPEVPGRFALGSWPPIDLLDVLAVREIEAPDAWSRVVPLSARTGLPLLRRDLPVLAPPPSRLDRAAAAVVGALTVTAGALIALLML